MVEVWLKQRRRLSIGTGSNGADNAARRPPGKREKLIAQREKGRVDYCEARTVDIESP
jgi:hypothetical protein